jgi:hypothetical protein
VVNFATPNIPGASDLYNKIAAKVAEKDTNVLSKLESTASELKAQLETDLEDLKSKIMAMIPELPELPSLNLQAEMTALSSLVPGTDGYASKLASIGTSFGDALASSGYSLDTIVSDSASAISSAASSLAAGLSVVSPSSALASKIPNFELPSGAVKALEVAQASLQPDKDAIAELASVFSADKTQDIAKAIFGDAVARESLEKKAAALKTKLEPLVLKFEAKAKRIEQQYKQANAETRSA